MASSLPSTRRTRPAGSRLHDQVPGLRRLPTGAYSADAGVDNVRKMLDDAAFLGMIGPYNSAVAKAEIPIAAPKNFVMISPANTNPCLTKDIAGCAYHPQDLRAGNPNNYCASSRLTTTRARRWPTTSTRN